MPIYDLRILLETVEGKKTSYFSSGSSYNSFIDTSQELVLSASEAYNRITGSVSASYQNQTFFSGSNVNTNFIFKDNLLLSASLQGNLNTGSIDFIATTSEYDRLYRYKFFGEKVCNVLGLPHAQWVYVDQFSLNPDDENNFFEGNVNAQNLFIGDSLTFANDSTINSDVPFLIDTGSDRHIKFIDERGVGTRALIIGYDKDKDVYEVSGSQDNNFNIGGVDKLVFADGTIQTTAGAGGGSGTVAGSDTQVQFNNGGNFGADANFTFNSSTDTLSVTNLDVTSITTTNITSSIITSSIVQASGSTIFGDAISDTHTFNGHITASGNISASGNLYVGGRKIYGNEAYNNYLSFNQSSSLFKVQSKTYIKFDGSSAQREVTVNEGTNDIDFVVKGEDNNPLLHADANTGKIGMNGIGTPLAGLHLGDNLFVESDITASGNISASGDLIVGDLASNFVSMSSGNISVSGHISSSGFHLPDNARITIGDENDLQLYHNGSHSFIKDGGSGNLILLASAFQVKNPDNDETMIQSNQDGAVTLFYNNSTKLSTQPSGVRVHGFLTASGDISGSDIYGSQGYFTSNDGTLLTLEREGSQNAAIKFENTQGFMVAGIDNDANNDGANVFGIGYVGDIVDSSGANHATFIVTGSQVVINNATSASAGDALTVGGNISASGNISANGNTTLGDASSDTHTFTGHITASGNISASGLIIASRFQSAGGSGELINFNDNLSVVGNITSSGNISASGDIFANEITLTGASAGIRIEGDSGTELTSTGTAGAFNISSAHDLFLLAASNKQVRIGSNNTNDEIMLNQGHITASGNISSSGTITAEHIVSSDDMIVTDRLGVGATSAPNATLHIVNPNSFVTFNDIQTIFSSSGTSGASDVLITDRDSDDARAALQVQGNKGSTEVLFASSTGKVGIQTTTPTKPLQVTGDISSSGDLHIQGNITASAGNFSSHITSSGTISASGAIKGLTLDINGASNILGVADFQNRVDFNRTSFPQAIFSDDGGTDITSLGQDGEVFLFKTNDSVNDFIFRRTDDFDIMLMDMSTEIIHISGGLNVKGINGNITASGNISSSGTIFGGGLDINGTTNFNDGNIQNVGNISLDTITSDSGDTVQVVLGTADGDDFKVSTTSETNILVVEGDTENIGIGTGTPTEKLDVDGNIKTTGNISSPTFFSGFAGSGFRITSGSDGGTSFTVDDLTVRGTMNVFELLIHQIRATNGSLFVSNTGKIISASLDSGGSTNYTLHFDTGSSYGHSFVIGDLVRAQRFVPSTNGSGSQVFKSDLHIISVNGTGSAVGVLTGSDAPQPGYEYVRIGNSNPASSSRQGSIYLTSDDDNAPFIDVVDEITAHSQFNTAGKTKVRMGKLSGITTTTFGTLPDYGFYASGSAFLEGSINATAGKIGGFGIDITTISSSNGKLILSSSGIISGSDVHFTGGRIGGFQIDEHSLTTEGVAINDASQALFINTSKFDVDHDGNITASNVSMSGNIEALTGTIGGFTIDAHSITTDGVEINKFGESTFINTNAFKVDHDGNITASNVDLTGKITATSGEFSGDIIATHINTDSGSIGGFTITPTAISSSNLVLSSSSTATDLIISTSKFQVDGDGGITASAANITGDIVANTITANTSGQIGGFNIDGHSITTTGVEINISTQTTFINTNAFKVDHAGNITASNVDLTGKITATSGEFSGDVIATHINTTSGSIGGFTITPTAISSSHLVLSSSATAGDFLISASNFNVKGNGELTASSVDLSGKITATSGEVGGFTIDGHSITTTGAEINDATQGTFINTTAFKVDHAGNITASNVSMSGNVEAGTGKIGGFTIDGHSLTTTGVEINDATQGTFINTNAFKVDHTGNVTASNVSMSGNIEADTGKIGGWVISDEAFTKIYDATGDGASDYQITLNSSGSPALEFHSRRATAGGGSFRKTMFISSDNDEFGENTSIISASNAIIHVSRTFAYGTGGSFTAGNKVLMSDNTYKNIEDIEENDVVLSYHVGEKQFHNSSVKSLITHGDKSYYIINNKLEATPNHKIYTLSGWKKVKELEVGDELIDNNLETVIITSLEFVEENVDVYDISLNGRVNNFFIENIFVHNATVGSLPGDSSGGVEQIGAEATGINTITGISNYSGSVGGRVRTAGVAGLAIGEATASIIQHIGVYGSSSIADNHYAAQFVGAKTYINEMVVGGEDSNILAIPKPAVRLSGPTVNYELTVEGYVSASGHIKANSFIRPGAGGGNDIPLIGADDTGSFVTNAKTGSLVKNVSVSATQGVINKITGDNVTTGITTLTNLGTSGKPTFSAITASGEITSSTLKVASDAQFGPSSVHIDGVGGHITASGNISSSGLVVTEQVGDGNANLALRGDNVTIQTDASGDIIFREGVNTKFEYDGSEDGFTFTGHITASGNISASGTITANSFVGAIVGTATGLTGTPDIVVGSLTATSITSSIVTSSIVKTEGSNIFGDTIADTHLFNGHITASGNISASGTQHIFGANVGIGTSPTVPLHVDSSTSDTVAIFKSSDSTARIQIQDDNTTNYIVSNTNSDSTLLSLGANNSTHAGNLNISSSGAVGIGVTDPDAKLEIIGEGDSSATKALEIKDSGGQNLFYVRNDGVVSVTHNYLFVQNSGGIFSAGSIKARGGITDDGGALGLGSNGDVDDMVISSSKVGIGTTSPSKELTVEGEISASGVIKGDGGISGSNGTFTGNVGITALPGASGYALDISGSTDDTRTLRVQTGASAGNNSQVLVEGNTSNSSPALSTAIDIRSNIDYRGRGIILSTATGSENQRWFAGVPYTGAGYSIGFSNASSNNLPWYDISSSLFIQEDGDVGIGTSSPAANLHVSDTAGSNTLETIRIENSNGYGELGVQSTYVRLLADGNLTYAANNTQTLLSVGGATKATLNSTGLNVDGHITASNNISASGGFHTFGGVLNVDEVRSVTQTTNKLILEDDQSLATNMVSLMSVNFVNIISDGNNNGTGKVRILDGNYDVDSATAVAEFSPEGIDFHAPLHISGTAANQKLLFIEDEIGNDILVVSSSNTLGKVGIGTSTPQNTLSVSGSLSVFAPDATSRITVGEQDTPDEATGNVVIIEGTGGSNKSRIFTKNTGNDMHIESLGNNSDIDLSAKRDIRFGINNGSAYNFTEKMIMSSSGNFGIGTSTPGEKLTIEGNISASGFVSASSFSGDGSGLTNVSATATPAGSDTQVQFNDGGSMAGDSGLTFNKTTNVLTVGALTTAGVISSSGGISSSADIQIEGDYSGSSTSTFTIGGKLQAGSKSFLIPRPEGGKLEYGALEGQQNDVFYRGELKGDNVIYLPKEWEWLVDKDTITVQLTSIGKHQELYIKEIKENKIFIDINGVFKTKENIHCYHVIHGTRKDIELIRNHQ